MIKNYTQNLNRTNLTLHQWTLFQFRYSLEKPILATEIHRTLQDRKAQDYLVRPSRLTIETHRQS